MPKSHEEQAAATASFLRERYGDGALIHASVLAYEIVLTKDFAKVPHWRRVLELLEEAISEDQNIH